MRHTNGMIQTKLREARKAQKLSQEQLAEKIGVTREFMSKVEGGKFDFTNDFAKRAAAALGCHPIEIKPDYLAEAHLTRDEEELLAVYRDMSAVSKAKVHGLALAIIEAERTGRNRPVDDALNERRAHPDRR